MPYILFMVFIVLLLSGAGWIYRNEVFGFARTIFLKRVALTVVSQKEDDETGLHYQAKYFDSSMAFQLRIDDERDFRADGGERDLIGFCVVICNNSNTPLPVRRDDFHIEFNKNGLKLPPAPITETPKSATALTDCVLEKDRHVEGVLFFDKKASANQSVIGFKLAGKSFKV